MWSESFSLAFPPTMRFLFFSFHYRKWVQFNRLRSHQVILSIFCTGRSAAPGLPQEKHSLSALSQYMADQSRSTVTKGKALVLSRVPDWYCLSPRLYELGFTRKWWTDHREVQINKDWKRKKNLYKRKLDLEAELQFIFNQAEDWACIWRGTLEHKCHWCVRLSCCNDFILS